MKKTYTILYLIMQQLSKEHYFNFKPAGVSVNAYAPQKEFSGIAEVNFFDLYNYISRRRKNK